MFVAARCPPWPRLTRSNVTCRYTSLNDHLVGANKTPTDAYEFSAEWTARIDWCGGD